LNYRPLDRDLEEKGEITYIDAAVAVIDELLLHEMNGDILVFMPTEQDIRECCELLRGRYTDNIQIFPLFSRLSWSDQKKVFHAGHTRRVIVATNIAETSLTIPGIRFVVDTGLARSLRFNPAAGTTSLPILPISQSSADQRKGRCGRVANGECFRLYSEADYQTRAKFNTPEIMRSSLAGVILKMLDLNLPDIHSFPFIDHPLPRAIKSGLDLLLELGAITRITTSNSKSSAFRLSGEGRFMAQLPIDPRVARMIIAGKKEKCLNDLIIIASALSVQDPRERPAEKEKQADEMHRLMRHAHSDFMTLLNIWHHYGRHLDQLQSQNKMRQFCREHFLSYRRMREWHDIYHQIRDILSEHPQYRQVINSIDNGLTGEDPTAIVPDTPRYKAIHRAILSGYLSHIAQKKEKKSFVASRGKEVFIFPGSGLFQKSGNWIVAAEFVETSRLYARTVAEIDPAWLEELGGQLCKHTYFDPHWDRDKGEVMANMQVSLFGLIIVPRRRVSYSKVDPNFCRERFLDALVDNDLSTTLPFLVHNQQLTKKIRDFEEKLRKRDLLVNHDRQTEFYRQRLPEVYSLQTLKKFIFERGNDKFLHMNEEDLLEKNLYLSEIEAEFPDRVTFGDVNIPLSYSFSPGAEDDGVTLKVPLSALSVVAQNCRQWIVPGWKEKWILGLFKHLPKSYRRLLHPIKEKAATLSIDFVAADAGLPYALSQHVKSAFGVEIPPSVWSTEHLDDYLKLRYVIVDEEGAVLRVGRDMASLFHDALQEHESQALAKARQIWEKKPVDGFSFEALPFRVSVSTGDGEAYFYTALTDEDQTLAIRLYRDPNEAEQAHRQGMIRCYAAQIKEILSFFKKTLMSNHELGASLDRLGNKKERIEEIMTKVIADVFDLSCRLQGDFKNSLAAGISLFPIRAMELLQSLLKVLKLYEATATYITELRIANRNNSLIFDYLARMQQILDVFFPPNFLFSCDDNAFADLIRYIRALRIRVERGVINIEKDRLKEKEVLNYWRVYERLYLELGHFCSMEKRDLIDDLKKMMEEYRISVFAPEIKTISPVSPKRLQEKIHEIENLL
jgi:ATP-dependent helicase HrpA